MEQASVATQGAVRAVECAGRGALLERLECCAAWVGSAVLARALAAGRALFRATGDATRMILHATVREPLQMLYFSGPALHGYGFWEGKAPADACAELTHTPSHFWVANSGECIALLNRHFDGFYVGFIVFLYCLALYTLLTHVWFRIMIMRPALRELKQITTTHRCSINDQN